MDVALRGLFYFLSIVLLSTNNSLVQEPQAKAPADKKAAEYADPKSTYRAYIEAIRNNDLKAAIRCWTVEDDNKCGALDVIVGLWISMRQINQVAAKKFGEAGLRAIGGWQRDDITDRALALTKKRLDDAEVKITGTTAELRIKWQESDGGSNPAFALSEEPTIFRKLNGEWKIDFNKGTGLKRGADFFEKGTWGPLFRDQVVIMNEAIDAMEKGRIKSAKELEKYINEKIEAKKKKYQEEERKANPKRK